MGLASRGYIAFLLASVYCHSFAASFQNVSGSSAGLQVSRTLSSDAVIHISSASSSSIDKDCIVKLFAVIQFNWVSNADSSPGTTGKETEHPISTNAAGTHITTVTWESGAYKRNGNWTALTGTTTLTFPTGFTYMAPGYVSQTVDGTSTGQTHYMTLSSGIAFPSPDSTLPASATGEGDREGMNWGLSFVGQNPQDAEIDYLLSMYPRESALHNCNLDYLLTRFQVPPIAVAPFTASSTTTSSAKGIQNTFATLDPVNPKPKATPGPKTNTGHATQATPSSLQEQTRHKSLLTSGHADGSTRSVNLTASSIAQDSESSTALHLAHDRQNRPKITIGTSTITADSKTRFKIGTKTVSPGGSPITISSTMYSLATKATEIVINGKTSALRDSTNDVSDTNRSESTRTPSTSLHGHELTVETLPGSEILVDDHTLGWTSTLTIGSGSVVTRVALGTNSAGQTVLLGDTTMKAPGTSCLGQCSVIRQSIASEVSNSPSTTSNAASSSSSSPTNPAARGFQPFSIALTIGIAILSWLIA